MKNINNLLMIVMGMLLSYLLWYEAGNNPFESLFSFVFYTFGAFILGCLFTLAIHTAIEIFRLINSLCDEIVKHF